ncbi:NAD(P)-binding protein [Pyrenochaeta sp. DS3sAY3a]|nr:NAD(P)-binding protein [Pyrenochaeta sp. DS3sAY3a]
MPCAKFDPNIDIPDLSGQVIIVTGGNVGLGLETIRQLAKHNPTRIYLAARSQEKAQAAIEELQKEASTELPIVFLHLDLSSFASIKSAAATINREESRLDLLINNAGIMMTQEALTADGYEIQFGTNVMGPALFTLLLLPLLRRTSIQHPQARVVNLASASEARAPADIYNFIALKTTMSDKHTTVRYTTSKIADIHFTSAVARRISDVRFVSVHPGMVATNLHLAADGIFLKAFLNVAGILATPVAKGAHSQLWAAVSPDAKHGGYYGPVGVPAGTKAALSVEKSEELWSWMREELRAHVDMPVELLS